MVLAVNEFQAFINIKLLAIGGHDLTVGQVLFVPLAVLIGYLLLGWLVLITTSQMQRRNIRIKGVGDK